jgi:hypothetical protein
VHLAAVGLAIDLGGVEGGAHQHGPGEAGQAVDVELAAELIQAGQIGERDGQPEAVVEPR